MSDAKGFFAALVVATFFAHVGTMRVTAAPAKQPQTVPKPRIVWNPIPFGAKRKAEMKAYAERHYGIDSYKLVHPHVIVIHYTVTPSFQSTFNTFAPDVPDPELHELPNTCAHFVVDQYGEIHQLVSINIMCRHTVGLNWTAIGIEHVGYSDAQVLDDRTQMRASLRARALAAVPLPHPDHERDRPQREPRQPLPPRERGVLRRRPTATSFTPTCRSTAGGCAAGRLSRRKLTAAGGSGVAVKDADPADRIKPQGARRAAWASRCRRLR